MKTLGKRSLAKLHISYSMPLHNNPSDSTHFDSPDFEKSGGHISRIGSDNRLRKNQTERLLFRKSLEIIKVPTNFKFRYSKDGKVFQNCRHFRKKSLEITKLALTLILEDYLVKNIVVTIRITA